VKPADDGELRTPAFDARSLDGGYTGGSRHGEAFKAAKVKAAG
jgi:hypothetical protein